MVTHETDLIFVTNLVMERAIDCETVGTTRCALNVLKATKIAMVGVLSSLARALALKALSASMAAWASTGTEMISDLKTGRMSMQKIDLYEDSTIFHEIQGTRMPIMTMTRIIAEMELVVAAMSRGSEIMMVLLLRLERETAMATDLQTEDGEKRTMMSRIEAIGTDRGDRRWDRDRNNDRQEAEPEWSMNEPAEEKSHGHTQEDFLRWKEEQQIKDKGGKTPAEEGPKPESGGGFFGLEKPKFEPPMTIDTGPDKFFGLWGTTPRDETGPDSIVESKNEGLAKSKTAGKASRFTSFFTPTQEEPPRRQIEPTPPVPAPPPSAFGALFQNGGQVPGDDSEKQAFQQLLQKLQRQTIAGSGTTPPANSSQQPKPPASEKPQIHANPAPDQLQQYRPERQEEGRPTPSTRNSQQALADLLSQRQVAGSQPTIRPEQMLQELVGQRQNALSQSSVRPDQSQNPNNTAFLMNLMKGQPEPQRTEQVMLRMPGSKPMDRQMDRQMQQQQMMEREQEMQREAAARERSASQRQARPPPGFYDDSFQRGPPPQHERPPQPTQILQRPPPPGLDQMQPGWAPPSQLPPPQHLRQQPQQHIAPPPGLAGRGMPPMPQQMFPPGFPGMGNFPPPEVMAGPRGMPPPGFFQGPPPGFLPPGFQGGPEGMAFGGPFDGRGPPPNGAFRRQ